MPSIEISEELNQRFSTEFKGQSIENLIESGLDVIGHDPKAKWRIRKSADKKWRWSYIGLDGKKEVIITRSATGWNSKEECLAAVERLRSSRNAKFDMPVF